jgi:hypothetical protein
MDEEYTVGKVVFVLPILKGMAEAIFLDGLRGAKSFPGIEKETSKESMTNIYPRGRWYTVL